MRKIKLIISYALALNMFILPAQNTFAESITIDAKQTTKSTESSSNKLNTYTSETETIPLFMQPGTIIIYDDDLNMTILQGGYSDKTVNINKNFSLIVPDMPENISGDEKESFKKLQKDIQEDIDSGEYNTYPISYPFPGEKVIYGDDGYVMHCYYRNDSEPSGYSIHLPDNYPTVTTIKTTSHWGKYNNYISYNDSDGKRGSTTGYGRFTQYSDKIGNHDNKLKDNDVATDQTFDTIKSGELITATNDDPNSPGYGTVYKKYIKNDVGPLNGVYHNNDNDAVLDVWGSKAKGLAHLGVKTGSDSTSLDKAHYYHKGINYDFLYKK